MRSLRIAQLISLATGRSLTGEHVFLRCKVLIVSLEDDQDELRRRVYAVLAPLRPHPRRRQRPPVPRRTQGPAPRRNEKRHTSRRRTQSADRTSNRAPRDRRGLARSLHKIPWPGREQQQRDRLRLHDGSPKWRSTSSAPSIYPITRISRSAAAPATPTEAEARPP